MKNLKKTLLKDSFDGYWVNKKTGTIHSVMSDIGYDGKTKLFNTTLNLRWERMYFFRGDGIGRFLKNYEFICNKDVDDNFFVNVLANVQLKNDLKWGTISKDEFFNKVIG